MIGYGCTGSGLPGQCQCPHCLNHQDLLDMMRQARRERDLQNDRYQPYRYDPYRRDTYPSSPIEPVDRLRRQVDSLQDDVRRLNVLVEKLISIFLPGEPKVP